MDYQLLCKKCNTSIRNKGKLSISHCVCGKLSLHAMGREWYVNHEDGKQYYAVIDENGNEPPIPDESLTEYVKSEVGNQEKRLPEPDEKVCQEMMHVIRHQISAMENLSQGALFSPATNQDLLAHLIWEEAVISSICRLVQKSRSLS